MIYYHLSLNSSTQRQTFSIASPYTFHSLYLTNNAEHIVLTLLHTDTYVMILYKYNQASDLFIKVKEIFFQDNPQTPFVSENGSFIIG